MFYTTPHRKLKFELDEPIFSIMSKGCFKYFTNINLKRHRTKNNYNMIIEDNVYKVIYIIFKRSLYFYKKNYLLAISNIFVLDINAMFPLYNKW